MKEIVEIVEIIGVGAVGFGFVALIAALLGFPTMILWNWLCPPIFGLPVITLWQALGLNLLTSILFKKISFSSSSSK